MNFHYKNNVVALCTQGMEMEGAGKPEEAAKLFFLAWERASDDFERFTAAHYVARHQPTVQDKLKWDLLALEHALNIKDTSTRGIFPSLYLNIGKCYEDLADLKSAKEYYDLGLSFCEELEGDGYGKMIKGGILDGLERIAERS